MFFTVKKPLRIAGKVYMPCICYTLTNYLDFTVRKLAEQGKAEIHEEMVFFQNGKIIAKECIFEDGVPETDTSMSDNKYKSYKKSKKGKKKIDIEEIVTEF